MAAAVFAGEAVLAAPIWMTLAPLAAAGDATLSVVLALAPGASAIVAAARLAFHPAGGSAFHREAGSAAGRTVHIVDADDVGQRRARRGRAALGRGVTTGSARPQPDTGWPKLMLTLAPAALTDAVVIRIPVVVAPHSSENKTSCITIIGVFELES